MSLPIVNLDNLQYSEFGKGDRVNAQRAKYRLRNSQPAFCFFFSVKKLD